MINLYQGLLSPIEMCPVLQLSGFKLGSRRSYTNDGFSILNLKKDIARFDRMHIRHPSVDSA